MVNRKCSGPSAIVNVLPVPHNATHAWIPGRNVSRPMTACCAPNPVQISEGCYEWYELPASYTSKSDDESELSELLYQCLEENHRNLNLSRAAAVHVPEDESESGAGSVDGRQVTFVGLVVWGLIASAFAVLGWEVMLDDRVTLLLWKKAWILSSRYPHQHILENSLSVTFDCDNGSAASNMQQAKQQGREQ